MMQVLFLWGKAGRKLAGGRGLGRWAGWFMSVDVVIAKTVRRKMGRHRLHSSRNPDDFSTQVA